VACIHGRASVAAVLLDRGAKVDARGVATTKTPLHWAAELNHEECARILFREGADLEAVDDK